jgi:hypothetical protein
MKHVKSVEEMRKSYLVESTGSMDVNAMDSINTVSATFSLFLLFVTIQINKSKQNQVTLYAGPL